MKAAEDAHKESAKRLKAARTRTICSGSRRSRRRPAQVPGATAAFTATRQEDGGTVLALSAQGAPWRYVPRALVSTQAGGTTVGVAGSAGLYDLSGGVPSADYVTLAVTSAGSAASGTVYMLYERWGGG